MTPAAAAAAAACGEGAQPPRKRSLASRFFPCVWSACSESSAAASPPRRIMGKRKEEEKEEEEDSVSSLDIGRSSLSQATGSNSRSRFTNFRPRPGLLPPLTRGRRELLYADHHACAVEFRAADLMTTSSDVGRLLTTTKPDRLASQLSEPLPGQVSRTIPVPEGVVYTRAGPRHRRSFTCGDATRRSHIVWRMEPETPGGTGRGTLSFTVVHPMRGERPVVVHADILVVRVADDACRWMLDRSHPLQRRKQAPVVCKSSAAGLTRWLRKHYTRKFREAKGGFASPCVIVDTRRRL